MKDFTLYPEALELKQLGFDEPCLGFYRIFSDGDTELLVNSNSNMRHLEAPTYSQAFRWFREKYNIDVSINTVYSKYNENTSKKYGGVTDNESVFTNVGFHNTYEEAELACLREMIKLVKK
jgi:hypothetical protein